MKTKLLRVCAAIALLLPASQQPANAQAQAEQQALMNVMRAIAVQADNRTQQGDAARQVLREVILQLQTGTPNPQWYGRDLWTTIALQTGNTGVYPQLRLLGPVRDVQVTGQTQLPAGMVYGLAARHQNGQSNWVLGYNNLSRRIEYATFEVANAAQAQPLPAPRREPIPAQQPTPSIPDSQPLAAGGETSTACKKFPNLC